MAGFVATTSPMIQQSSHMHSNPISHILNINGMTALCTAIITPHAKLSGTAYCDRSYLWVCLFVCVCVWVCYNNNSKLRASILIKLGLQVKVVTISRLIKFWPSRATGKGVCGGAKFFWLRLTTASMQCLRISERFVHSRIILAEYHSQ